MPVSGRDVGRTTGTTEKKVYWKSIPLCLLAFQLSDSGLQRWHQTNRKILSSRVTGSTHLLSIILRLSYHGRVLRIFQGNQTVETPSKIIRNICQWSNILCIFLGIDKLMQLWYILQWSFYVVKVSYSVMQRQRKCHKSTYPAAIYAKYTILIMHPKVLKVIINPRYESLF